jgi:hypothetical protein
MFNSPLPTRREQRLSVHWFKTPRLRKMAQFSQHLGDASWNTKAQLQQQHDDMMKDNNSLNSHHETISACAKG